MDEVAWSPDESAVARSQRELAIAATINDRSLDRLREASITPGLDETDAAAARGARAERRLDTSPDEQRRAARSMDALGWMVVILMLASCFTGTIIWLSFRAVIG